MVNKVGLAVMRLQPLHKGHCRFVIDPMIEDCEVAIIGLGSAQESGTLANPYTVDTRIQMIKNIYGDRIKTIPLHDITAPNYTSDWVAYVIDRIKKLGLPEPTDYYSGSEADASWYSRVFCEKEGKRLHIASRQNNEWLTATEIRTLVQMGQYSWKNHVPAVNHRIVEHFYPLELKVYMG